MTGENPFSFANNKTQTSSQIVNHTQDDHGPVAGAHDPKQPRRPTKAIGSGTPRAKLGSLEGYTAISPRLHLARGLGASSGETPPCSRAGHPLGWDSASLEG
jgi:hypothetical protein